MVQKLGSENGNNYDEQLKQLYILQQSFALHWAILQPAVMFLRKETIWD